MFTKDQHEAIITDVDKFNQFIKDYTEIIMQRVMLDIPNMVLYHIKDIKEVEKLREKFYKDYPNLKDHKNILSKVVTRIAHDNPDWDRSKVFDTAGKECNRLLTMEKSNEQGF